MKKIILLVAIIIIFLGISGCVTNTNPSERVLPSDFVKSHTDSFFYIYGNETIIVNYTPVGDENFMTIEPYTRICGKGCYNNFYDTFVYRDFTKNISQPISLYQYNSDNSYMRKFDGVRIMITGNYQNQDYIIKKLYYIYPDFNTNSLLITDMGY